MTVLYEKRGRSYVISAHAQDYSSDVMRAGTWRLTYCYDDGAKRYSYDVRPDTAGFIAACEMAALAMEKAIHERAKYVAGTTGAAYTTRQLKLIEKFRADMTASGGLMPAWWTGASAREIAQAGIDAVRNFGIKE